MLAAPWLVGAVLTLWLRRWAVLFTPGWLAKALAVTAVALAITTWTSALALATTAIGIGSVPIRVAAVLLGAALVWTSLSAVHHSVRVGANLRAGRLFRDCPGRVGDVLLVDSTMPDAFAVPGRRAVVVITSALASELDDKELSAVIEHERAHLSGRHWLLIQAVHTAARLNPLVHSWCAAVRFAAERAADERAAAGDRGAALRAVARAALLCSATASPAWVGIGGESGEVMRRVHALRRPGPRPQRRWLLAAVCAVVLALAANFVVIADIAQDRIAPERGEPADQVLG
ncbi:M48 family metalloprotease [Mycobacterium sp. CVI_P3]|uniref:M48 family metalloprotease n=1 Tax=Mycobacterium pinniadriaticum TaxID=2994102 RepID=A0ABT3SDF2_9MYCO|nr:M48 family metalloprotease [Mycobacterium pinniadriaticum]MCX2931244.1 M48 family metalloprotease [Mycobacterium pinniadriaticum]MCX2937532.1 M48 family metalloprotease [Mycobacterium pinniadriaticum]